MKKKPESLYQSDLKMSAHLRKIRDKLWMNDSKSRVSVMIGSGFSKNASKIEPSFEGIAVWEELKEQLIKDLTHHENIKEKGVLEIGQIYSEEYGRSSLDEVIKASVPDDNYEPGVLHAELLNLPWTDIYTTNYDTLLERANRNVYERSYQVIYDINDIPSSMQPRIIKLHGSFPANRPFIFTTDDFETYPIKFSPFVNMVQQSIMETTFVLIGFSGDDPNFTQWTSWVQNNLKEHMPTIYMIGYNEELRRNELKEKGITLIDFKKIYEDNPNPYTLMFYDLFDFLSYKDKLEKTKWPHQLRIKVTEDNYGDNRETYPGWVVLPDEIRKDYSRTFWRESVNYLMKINLSEIDESVVGKVNETIWYYDKFHLPLNDDLYEKLQDIVDSYGSDKAELIPIILRLLKEARLRYDSDAFLKYKKICETESLSGEDCHALKYEGVLYHLDLNNIEEVVNSLSQWKVGKKDLDWGIKQACIYTRIEKSQEAETLLEEYLQTVRQLLAIKMDDYRLLSLESIILHHLSAIDIKYSAKDRLRSLSIKYCDSGKEFKSLLRSIKEYNQNYGTKRSLLFDPGREVISTKFNDSFDEILNESMALTRLKEEYNFYVIDSNQYETALKNIHEIYPEYSLIKRIQMTNLKEVVNLLTREYVYSMEENEKEVLVRILENSLIVGRESTISSGVALEIYSRIYMILKPDEQQKIDNKIFEFIEDGLLINLPEIKTARASISRIFFAKSPDEAVDFTKKIIALRVKNQSINDQGVYMAYFFDPILEIFDHGDKVKGMKVSPSQFESLLDTIENSEDNPMVESAFLRLAFLCVIGSLDVAYRERVRKVFKSLENNRPDGITAFIRIGNIDNLVDGTNDLPNKELDNFINEEIPIFYKENSMSDGSNVIQYFKSVRFLFRGISGLDETKVANEGHYHSWLDKIYIWWDSQKKGLLRNVDYISPLIPIDNLLLSLIVTLKNNIWGTIPVDYIREKDEIKALEIFNEIFSKESEVALLLIPSLQRMRINHPYTLKYTLESLSDPNIRKSKSAIISLYDFVLFINKDEIDEDVNVIKEELLQILKYGSGERLSQAIKVFGDFIERNLDIVDSSLASILIIYLNRFLITIKNDESLIETREDFVLLENHAKLVALMVEYKSDDVGTSFEEWKDYISTHKLPEVKSSIIHFKNK